MSELIGKIKEKRYQAECAHDFCQDEKAGEVGRKKSSWEKKECDR